jgi:hypothetical protein
MLALRGLPVCLRRNEFSHVPSNVPSLSVESFTVHVVDLDLISPVKRMGRKYHDSL